MAAFWYNPYQGILRARVPVMISDEESLSVYNRINSSSLTSIFPKGSGGDLLSAIGDKSDDDGPDAPSRAGNDQIEVTATGQVIKKGPK
jgi:hypothetical protein